MIEDIINAISKRLYELFGDGYTIYLNDVKQGLEEPCFIITVIEQVRNNYLNGRYNINVPIDVVYIPRQENYNVYHVEETLLDNLEMIGSVNQDNKYLGRNMRSEAIEKELHFFVEYSCIKNIVISDENDMDEIAMERN